MRLRRPAGNKKWNDRACDDLSCRNYWWCTSPDERRTKLEEVHPPLVILVTFLFGAVKSEKYKRCKEKCLAVEIIARRCVLL